MKQQTAVEWLIDNWIKFNDIDIELDDFANLRPLLEQAKQMEKEQIMKAARQCHFEGVRQSAKTSEEYIEYAEQYYNETYNK